MAKGRRGGFPGMGGGNMNALLKQAQKMQQEMQEAQEGLAEAVYESSVGGGTVNLKMNGRHEVLELNIKPEAVDPEDIEMLQDLIIAAVNDANAQIEKAGENAMGRFSGLMPGF